MKIPVITGPYREIIPAKDPGVEEDWFTNDHCFFQEENGTWHCFAINNPYFEDFAVLYREHPYLLHATAPDLHGPWKRESFALDDSGGHRFVGASFVVQQSGTYKMLVAGMWGDVKALEIAQSDDLYTWHRDRQQVITNQPPRTRDPCILWDEASNEWWIYLCSVDRPRSLITRCRTKDFVSFSEPEIVLELADDCPHGSLESPFVVSYDGKWYLFFTNTMFGYHETVVIVSETPNQFRWEDQLTTLYAHAPEIIQHDGRWFITTCGPEVRKTNSKAGIQIAPLSWLEAK